MHPQQGCLFDLGAIDFRRVRETKERILQATKAVNTLSAYASSWKAFCRWCREAGREALPATPETVEDFASWAINEKFRLNTVFTHTSAIAHYHAEAGLPSPVDQSVRKFLSNAKRDLKEAPGGKAAVTPAQLRKLAKRLASDDPIDIRDRAMILVCFAAGWRRSELIGLDRSDVKFVRAGMTLWLRASKTDQTGEGRLVAIQRGKRPLTCPVLALRKWLKIRGDWEGPLFVRFTPDRRLTHRGLRSRGEALHQAVKQGLAQIGEDPRKFGAHSLRAGMITAAAQNGATETSIMMRTGHKSSQTLRRYIRPAQAFHANPLKGVL